MERRAKKRRIRKERDKEEKQEESLRERKRVRRRNRRREKKGGRIRKREKRISRAKAISNDLHWSNCIHRSEAKAPAQRPTGHKFQFLQVLKSFNSTGRRVILFSHQYQRNVRQWRRLLRSAIQETQFCTAT
jgi:hypothetical protein